MNELAQSCLTLCDPMDCSLTRFFHPWDFPVKDTGVGCHFLLQKILELPYDPAIALLGIHTEETRTERDTCTPMFIVALFTIARTRKQSRCTLAVEWIRELWCTYTMEYSVQSSHSVVSDSLRPHESQHTRPPCPSPTLRVHPDSRPSSQ